ncbi:hypothetical protein ONS95_010447 [Cadophora gregata]|uniref:uncharacterized protein n=1 Tax=Cadophora gregata TaxID=51156 RepID=UPI0026DBFAB5|nr:uncharacterized protein ONS95_010447 [Cadophora gregata]KAK0122190.1 hypothetical protein ONS95_010447 [Cadophora gregata]
MRKWPEIVKRKKSSRCMVLLCRASRNSRFKYSTPLCTLFHDWRASNTLSSNVNDKHHIKTGAFSGLRAAGMRRSILGRILVATVQFTASVPFVRKQTQIDQPSFPGQAKSMFGGYP